MFYCLHLLGLQFIGSQTASSDSVGSGFDPSRITVFWLCILLLVFIVRILVLSLI